MGLYWRDLLAWQKVIESDVTTPAGGGVVQLCQQDPARIYLAICIGAAIDGQIVITTQPSPPGPLSGLPLLTSMQGSNGAVSIDLNNGTIEVDTSAGPTPFAVNLGTGDGTFGDATQTVVSKFIMGAGQLLQFLMTFPGFNFQQAPCIREFEVARHGALCQSAWYALDSSSGGANNLHVIAVRQESGPCDTGPLKSVMAPAKPTVVSWNTTPPVEETADAKSQGNGAQSVQSVFRPNWDNLG